jgi:hypothetical protein
MIRFVRLSWRKPDSNFESRFQKSGVPIRIRASQRLALLSKREREWHRPRRGTRGSNPLPSSGESSANLTSDAAQHFGARKFDVVDGHEPSATTRAKDGFRRVFRPTSRYTATPILIERRLSSVDAL